MRLVADNGDAVSTESAESINYFLALGYVADKEEKKPEPKAAPAKKAAAPKPTTEK